jgi:hypothetical protein
MLNLTEMAQDTTTNDQIQGLPRAWLSVFSAFSNYLLIFTAGGFSN